MNKQNKTKLLFIFSTIFFVAIAVTACNNKEAEKTVTTDTVTTIKADTMPAIDTMLLDSGKVKPTPDPN